MGLSILFNYILPLESRFCNISYYFVVGTLQRGLKKKKEGKKTSHHKRNYGGPSSRHYCKPTPNQPCSLALNQHLRVYRILTLELLEEPTTVRALLVLNARQATG